MTATSPWLLVDYWRWTHEGLAKLFRDNAEWASVRVDPAAGTAATLGMLLGTFLEIGARRAKVSGLARGPVWSMRWGSGGASWVLPAPTPMKSPARR